MFWFKARAPQKGLQEAVALRQGVTTPEKAQIIGRTFKTAGFEPLMRDTMKGSRTTVPSWRQPVQTAIGEMSEALSLL